MARLDIANLQPEHRQVVKSREAELSGLVSFVRRQFSFTVAQQQAKLLLDHIQLLGPGAAEAAARRDQAVRIEAGARREREAQAVLYQARRQDYAPRARPARLDCDVKTPSICNQIGLFVHPDSRYD